MEKYELIDMQKFDRADYFSYFMSVGTTIEFTAKVDVTKVIEKCKHDKLNFQAVMLYQLYNCLLYTSPSPRDGLLSRMPSSA